MSSNILYNSGLDLNIVPMPAMKTAPKVVGIHPTGANILIELLGQQELMSGKILVGDNMTTDGPPQAYILEVGPTVCEEIRALVGKRVVVNGRGVNVPELDNSNGRIKLLVEYPMIKGVLEEEVKTCCKVEKAEKNEKKKCCKKD